MMRISERSWRHERSWSQTGSRDKEFRMISFASEIGNLGIRGYLLTLTLSS